MKKLFFYLTTFLITSFCVNAQTFEFKNSGTDYILYDLSIPANNNNIAYAAGSQYTTDNATGIVIKTEDAGENWTTIYQGNNIQTIAFFTTEKGFAAGFTNTMLKTVDGGANWQEVGIGADVYMFVTIRFRDENNGATVFITEDFEFGAATTSDGGETWVLSTTPPQHPMVKMNYAGDNTLYAVGYGGSVYKSTDGGDNWILIKSGPEINLGVYFKDEMNGIVAGEEGDLYITHDGGDTWEDSLFTGYHHFYGLNWKGDKIMAAGTDEDIFMSEDDGHNYNVVFNGTGDDQMYEIGFFDDNSGLIVGSGGRVLKFTDLYMATNEIRNNQPMVYPNPAKDVIYISTDKKIDQLQLFDMSGKLVLTQTNMNAGNKLDISKLSKGIYILKINSGGLIHTQKISKK